MGAALDPAACDAMDYAAGAALAAAATAIIGFVGVQLGGAPARPASVPGPHTRHRIQGGG
jgi:hypothetical protein